MPVEAWAMIDPEGNIMCVRMGAAKSGFMRIYETEEQAKRAVQGNFASARVVKVTINYTL